MSAFFIAGTGTDIGKTFTTCALACAARQAGRAVMAYKPIVSGFQDHDDPDTSKIIAALGHGDADTISPWRFEAPLSPDMAAAREGRTLSVSELVTWTHVVARQPKLVLIETIGGLMVPLNARETTRDWVQQANLPLIMVTGSYLGALSHTLTTLEAARAAQLKIAALIVNESACGTVDLQETLRSLRNHIHDIPLILAQPRVSSIMEATHIRSLLGNLA